MYDIPVIEDAAEGLGSTLGNQKLGSFGDIGIFSFNGNKIITTSGGGALVSKNGDWVTKAKFLSTQARDSAPHYQHSAYAVMTPDGKTILSAYFGLERSDGEFAAFLDEGWKKWEATGGK